MTTIERREQAVTDAVVASFAGAKDDRLREVLQSLTRHLHAFARDVRLTNEEWEAAIGFLTRAGHITDDVRQEFILLSDTLGASMQTINVNNQAYEGATEATVFGPFFVEDAPRIDLGEDMAFGAPGEPCWVEGTVTDTDGRPLSGARIEVWEATRTGSTTCSTTPASGPAGPICSPRPTAATASGGSPRRRTPSRTTDPSAGCSTRWAARRRAAHLHFMVSHEGARTRVTHIFPEGDPIGRKDTVFGVKDSLIKRFGRQAAGTPAPDGRVIDGTWSRVRFDIALAPAGV